MAKDDKQDRKEYRVSDAEAFAENMMKVTGQIGEMARRAFVRSDSPLLAASPSALTPMFAAFSEVAKQVLREPEKIVTAQAELFDQYAALWRMTGRRLLGEEDDKPAAASTAGATGDRRFSDADWQDIPVFDFMKQSYLLTAKWAHDQVQQLNGIDDHTRHKADFYLTQIENALSPSNFILTNPQVLRETLKSNGENLVRGLENLARDFDNSKSGLQITQTDFDAFEVGGNLALSEGAVVFRNDLIELIQYHPTTPDVHALPLLIVPPWINKFYILDLTPEKSFIKWVVDQGFTVFVISWVNPDETLREKAFAEYMKEGVLAALDAMEKATGAKRHLVTGYCIGGTLLATTLAYMATQDDDRIAAATFLTTQVDFVDAGDLKVFIDDQQLSEIEAQMAETGYLDGASMGNVFNMLRSNDLIWSYVVNNYLMGRDPFPFDLLYWNADTTRMPAAMHSFYLREFYQNNYFATGKLVLEGVKLDPGRVKTPVYNLGTREDHIAPIGSVAKIGRLLGGPVKLVVAGSGHIAGVVNPPSKSKYQHWVSDKPCIDIEAWLEDAKEVAGSWWPDWAVWAAGHAGEKIPARKPGEGKLKALEPAPGSYVRQRGGNSPV